MNASSRPSNLLIALALLFSVIATACGSVDAPVEQLQALENTDSAPAAAPAPGAAPAPAQAPADGSAAPTPATAENGHQYGSTLDEWSQTEEARGQRAIAETPEDWDGYLKVAWQDLIPAGSSGEELMAQYEDELDAVRPGSDEAMALWEEIQAAYNPEAVNTDLDGQKVLLAGFVAPLTYDDDIITEFLLVPTFGACIHVPPPPPNQTVMVSADKDNGLTIDDSWGAVWVTGTIQVESGDSDLGATSYRITDVSSGPYAGV